MRGAHEEVIRFYFLVIFFCLPASYKPCLQRMTTANSTVQRDAMSSLALFDQSRGVKLGQLDSFLQCLRCSLAFYSTTCIWCISALYVCVVPVTQWPCRSPMLIPMIRSITPAARTSSNGSNAPDTGENVIQAKVGFLRRAQWLLTWLYSCVCMFTSLRLMLESWPQKVHESRLDCNFHKFNAEKSIKFVFCF